MMPGTEGVFIIETGLRTREMLTASLAVPYGSFPV
jgi:hypothetical protein